MIALLAYKSSYLSKDPLNRFDIWLRFYKMSGTNLPIKIFTDYNSNINELLGYPVTRITAIPPVDKNNGLPYSDWLRSEMYDMVKQPLVYMDLDCLLLKPIDPILSVKEGMAMAYNSGNAGSQLKDSILGKITDGKKGLNCNFNSGVMVFNRSFKQEYQQRFIDNPDNYNTTWNIYGELIWDGINRQHGSVLDPSYNILISDIMSNHFRPEFPKVLHCHADTAEDVLSIVKWITITYKDFNHKTKSLANKSDSSKS